MKLSVIIPVYNELHTLREIINRVRAVEGIEKEIILVDDFSTDGTRSVYPELETLVDKIVLHTENQGKGAAIRTGIQYATGDYTVIQDADLEYDPQEYHLLLSAVMEGKADVVYGSRFFGGRPHRVLFFWHSVGNKFLTLLSNMFTNLNLTDMETCYKLVRTDVFKSITIEQNRFGFEPEITAKLAAMDLRIFEVGISYDGRGYDEGKKIGWKDGFQALWCIVKYSRGRYRDYGKQTLQTLSGFNQYSQWMYSRLRHHLGHRVMEIGCGIGNNLDNLSSAPGSEIILTDPREDYLQELRKKFGDRENVSFFQYDATEPAPPGLTAAPPDTIVMLNVLEHIKEDELALRNLYDLVQPGGRLVVLVPAFQSLYCKIDANLEHFRRYSMTELQDKMLRAGFQLAESFYFNAVGAAGWFVAGKVLRASEIKEGHVAGQKLMMPIARAVDSLKLPIGLSVVCVGRKPDELQHGAAAGPLQESPEKVSAA